MLILSKSRFLAEYKSYGIALDSRYSPPQTLVFPASPDSWRSWDIPASAKDLPRFVSAMFEATEEETGFYLYPRQGAWGCGDSLKLFQMSAIFNALDIIPKADDVIYASVDQMDAIETLFTIALVFGGSVGDDIFAVPSHGRMILYADHHEAVIAQFASSDTMKQFQSKVSSWDVD